MGVIVRRTVDKGTGLTHDACYRQRFKIFAAGRVTISAACPICESGTIDSGERSSFFSPLVLFLTFREPMAAMNAPKRKARSV